MKFKTRAAKIVFFILIINLIFIQPVINAQKKIRLKSYFNRIIVKFKRGASSKKIDQVISKVGYLTKSQKLGASMVYIIRPKSSLQKSLKFLHKNRLVDYASADYKRRLFYTPSDPAYSSSQWSLEAMKVGSAWNRGESDGWLNNNVTVAVIDTGIDSDHPDLASNLWVNTDEVPSNGIDDDNNGYIDDRNGNSWGALSNYALTLDNFSEFIKYTSSVDLGAAYPEQKLNGIAQSISGTGGKLKSLSFMLERIGTPKDITVSLTTSAQNKPASILASFTIKASDVLDSEKFKFNNYEEVENMWVEKSFNQAVTLNSGQTYFIVLSTQNSSSRSYYTIYLNRGYDYFTSGNVYTMRKVGTNTYWSENPKTDLIFLSDATGSNIEDGDGHGSSVNGIIGAVHNSIGGAGIVPAARLMNLKVSNASGYISDSAVIEAIYYAVNNGASVINLSLGGSSYSKALEEATDYAYNNGVVVVAVSGNDGEEATNYPAANRNVISVGAMSDDNSLADFSTIGDSVDVTAPGVDVYTTDKDGAYTSFSGTSAAAPQVAAMVGLLKLQNPAWSPEAIISRITNTATDLGQEGRDKYFGHGQVNFEDAFGSTAFSAISTSVSRGYIYYRSKSLIRGLLKVGNWQPTNILAQAPVSGYYKSYGQLFWTPFFRGNTASDGSFSKYISPSSNTDVRFVFGGNSNYQRANTEFKIYVRPLIYISIVRHGKNALVKGKILPKHKGVVSFYRSKNGRKWRKIANIKLDPKGYYRLLFKPRKGRYYYRIGKSADKDHAAGKSVKKVLIGR